MYHPHSYQHPYRAYGSATPYGASVGDLDGAMATLFTSSSVPAVSAVMDTAPSNEIGALYRIAYAFGRAGRLDRSATGRAWWFGRAMTVYAAAKAMQLGRYTPLGLGFDLGKYATADQISEGMRAAAKTLVTDGHTLPATLLLNNSSPAAIKMRMAAEGEEAGLGGKRDIPLWGQIKTALTAGGVVTGLVALGIGYVVYSEFK